jgi:signal transduction histidine kinase
MLGAQIAAIGINLLVAATCLFVRYARARRDWLTPLAAAHLCNAGLYALAAMHPGPESFRPMVVGWIGLFFLALQALNPLFMLVSVLRLHARLSGLAAEAAILALGVAGLACFWLTGEFLLVFGAGQGFALLVYVLAGLWLWRGPTAFYRVVGATLVLRGLYAGTVIHFSSIEPDLVLLAMLIELNLVFVVASGFGSLLIEFDDTRHELVAANAAKANFLANTSHELRTPLNAILGFAQLIERSVAGPISERYRQYARDILAAGNHLLRIVDQLLNMAAVEHRAEALRFEQSCIREIVAASVSMVRVGVADRKLRLRVDLPDAPVPAVTDPQALRHVVLNLLENAVKFSPAGGEVRVTLRADDLRALITVGDQGPGISEADQKKIFVPFWQAESALSRQYQGMGLGLALSDRLVRALGGKIAVASALGAGTTFTVSLPRRPQTV